MDASSRQWNEAIKHLQSFDQTRQDSHNKSLAITKAESRLRESMTTANADTPSRKKIEKLLLLHRELKVLLEEEQESLDAASKALSGVRPMVPVPVNVPTPSTTAPTSATAPSQPKPQPKAQQQPQLSPETLVAVKIDLKSTEWLLCRIIRYIPQKNLYEIVDIEDPSSKFEVAYPKIFVVPEHLPDRIPPVVSGRRRSGVTPDPTEYNEYVRGTGVLALYPETTCLYRATVVTPPSQTPSPNKGLYAVQFDEEEEVRYVPVNRVLEWKG